MYRAYWNMEFDPFSKEIDIKNLFKTNDFNEALTRLEFLNTTKGIGLFTGNPGSGKTYAVKYFLENLNSNLYKIVYLPLTTISVMDFYQALAISLGLETCRSKTKLFFDIQNYIKQLVQEQKKNLVIAIDEAQLLSKEILTDIKILFNFDMDSKNMVTLILIGLPVINHTLSKRVFEDLAQRIVMKYDFNGIMPQIEQVYNNTAAHSELKAMMNRNERLSLYFTIDRYGYEAIRVESKTTKNFAYQIDQAAFAWVMNYLMKGETEDFNVKPEAVAKSEETDANKFRKDMLKLFVENRIGNIQFTPEFRDRTGKLTAVASFRNGTILFFMERDEEITDYLREKGLIR